MPSLKSIFADEGLLAQAVEGFAARPQQLEMAEAILETLKQGTALVAEAGTGTGKTFAYLAPVILSGQKVFISTGTKNLQDQLFSRDLPTLRKALGVPFDAALLKGRSNYLCHYRLRLSHGDPLMHEFYVELQAVEKWSKISDSGDLSEVDLLEERSPIWPQVTSTIDNCVGQDCPDYAECFVNEARKRAQEADVVVVNHHLLMSDMAMKSAGQGEILPSADAYIIDEAHQLPAIASQFLSVRISNHQIVDWCRDAVTEMTQDAPDMAEIKTLAAAVESALQRLRTIVGSEEQRVPWKTLATQPKVLSFLSALIEKISALQEGLALAAPRGKGLAQCNERGCELLGTLAVFESEKVDDNAILWAEVRGAGFSLYNTPHDVSPHFQQWMVEKPASWVFTSATLTVAGKFEHFQQQLGIADSATAVWESPFDYGKQSLLYMPNIPVEPSSPDYASHINELAKDLIATSEGRAFLLFTSYRAMNAAAAALDGSDYPLLVQGTKSKSNLLAEFRSHGNAVLLGTNSFWEGVDVRGEALSCVFIDKIPFASPGDPVLQARIDGVRNRGGNPFQSIQIPAAVIQLKQGIGRLIRDVEDYGVLVLCDPRLLTKPYGKLFLRSLPAMPITQNIEDVATFFEQH